MYMGFFDLLQKAANTAIGEKYRDIYFKRYPIRYHICRSCGKRLDKEVPREVTIDHIFPRKFGGTNAITNLQVLCQPCNSKKKDKIDELTLRYSGEALIREARRVFRG